MLPKLSAVSIIFETACRNKKCFFFTYFLPGKYQPTPGGCKPVWGRVWTTRRSRVPGGPTQCRSSLPEGSKPRRDHLFVGRRPREKPCLPRKGVEGVHRVPGNL